MAVMLVENMSAHFDPTRYRDDYREALIQVVESKLSNQPIERPDVREPGKVTDLMAALKASVEAAKSRRSESEDAEGSAADDAESLEPARRRRAS
jgi:DNA end-binding protein Ku